MREKTVQDKIQLKLARLFKIRLFDNINGLAFFGKPKAMTEGIAILIGARPKRVGWGVGSPDLLGWYSVLVTEEMVGKRLAVLSAFEIKKPGQKPDKDQRAWLELLIEQGALVGWADSEDGAIQIVEDWNKQWKQQ